MFIESHHREGLVNLKAMEESRKLRTELSFIKSNGLQYIGKIKRRQKWEDSCHMTYNGFIPSIYKKFSYINKKKIDESSIEK